MTINQNMAKQPVMAVREWSETWTKVHGNILDQYVQVEKILGTRPYLVMLPDCRCPSATELDSGESQLAYIYCYSEHSGMH